MNLKKTNPILRYRKAMLVILCISGVSASNIAWADITANCPAVNDSNLYCYNPDSGDAPSSTAPSGYVSSEINPVIGDYSLGGDSDIIFALQCPSSDMSVSNWGFYDDNGGDIDCSEDGGCTEGEDYCDMLCTNWSTGSGIVNINSYECTENTYG
jgi:hypothetical protein